MTIFKLDNLGEIGVIKDLPSYNLPVNAWSDSINVDFEFLTVKRSFGYISSVNIGAPVVTPFFSFTGKDSQNNQDYNIYAGLQKVYAIINGVHNNITRGTSTASAAADVNYSATVNQAWTACEINGYLILNNNGDVPQKWTSAVGSVNLSGLDGWTSTVRAAVVRSYRNYLVALDVTKAGVRFPHLIRWSTSASLGQVPLSWDITNPTNDAGQNFLADTPDYLIDCAVLRDTNIVYKEETTWGMKFIGFPFVFQFFELFHNSGIMSRNCVIENDDKHYVLTKNDVIVHDGQTIQSLVEHKLRRHMFNNINEDNAVNSFVTLNKYERLLIVGIPFSANYPDRLFIYKITDGTWNIRDINPVNSISIDFGVALDVTWDTLTDLWDTSIREWHAASQQSIKMIAVSSQKNKLYSLFSGVKTDEGELISRVERTGYSFLNVDTGSNERELKIINYIRPEISASTTTVVNIYIGVQDIYNENIDWGTPYAFNTATDKEAWFFRVGRYFGVKFESLSGNIWELKSYSIDIAPFGLYK